MIRKIKCKLGRHEFTPWVETEASKFELSPFDQWLTRWCIHCERIETVDKLDYDGRQAPDMVDGDLALVDFSHLDELQGTECFCNECLGQGDVDE